MLANTVKNNVHLHAVVQ